MTALERACAARFAAAGDPVVTVIVPVFNHWKVTQRALSALVHCDPDVPMQLVVVDDASSDETGAALTRLRGVDVVRNGRNMGFVDGCNRGAHLARGRYLFFLNNDTEIRPQGIRALVQRADGDATIGIVGSKLVYPDGRLQEAGGIIWSDASGRNYGRYDSPDRPEYAFVRDVDYVSGAALLVRTELFRALGGFDARYAPAYYEDVDLCFAARAHGLRVVYEPRSVVVHHEGTSAGTNLSSGMKRFQARNQPIFRAKWHGVLEREHLPSDDARIRTAARLRGGQRRALLIVDSYVPLHDREAGSNRLRRLIDGLVAAGERIVFFPDNRAQMQPYTAELEERGVEVLYHTPGDRRGWRELLADGLDTVDAAWVCRPNLVRQYLPAIRSLRRVPVLYDTIDLHYVRLRRQAEIEGRADDTEWRRYEELELTCGRAADGTIVVSEVEARLLRDAGIGPVAVVPTIHDMEPDGERDTTASAGLLFIGGYNHSPNVDAVRWLVHEVMPRVWGRLPEVQVTLLGANPPPEVTALAGRRVFVPGFVPDVRSYFGAARIFVAPIRYGAGVNGKIGQALAYRLPVVTTPVGAEGFGLTDGTNSLIAEDTEAFAAAIVRLYEDAELRARLAASAERTLQPFSTEHAVGAALELLDRVAPRRPPRNFPAAYRPETC